MVNCIGKIFFWAFLQGGIGEETNFHLVKWNKVCTPLSSGGLGIWNLRTFNKAHGKLLRRYHPEGVSYWKTVIDLKYWSLQGGWCSYEVRTVHGVGLRNYNRNGWEDFDRFIKFEVGDGEEDQFLS